MANTILDQEEKAIQNARDELMKAVEEFDKQVAEYKKFGSNLAADLESYRESRSRWLL